MAEQRPENIRQNIEGGKVPASEREVGMRSAVVTEPWPEMVTRREPVAVVPPTWWMPPTGGLMEILVGSVNALAGIGMIVGSSVFGAFSGVFSGLEDLLPAVTAGVGVGVILLILGIVSIIGGIYALRRRVFGMSLAGAITALFPSPAMILGILSLIFVVLGKAEFRR